MTTLALPSLISAATPAEYIVIPLSRYPLIPKYRPLPFPPSLLRLVCRVVNATASWYKNTPLPMSGRGAIHKGVLFWQDGLTHL